MTSKNLFSKLVRQNLTRSLWAVTLAALGCLTALTLPVVFTIQQYYENLAALQRDPTSWPARPGLTAAESLLQSMSESVSFVVSFDNPLLKLVLIVLAILCGVAMFRYLHDKRQVDFYHALPISRGRLFLVQYVTGVAAVIPVYLIVLLLTLAASCAMGFGGAIAARDVLTGIVGHLTFFLLNYTVAVLCTVMTGNTVITVLLGVWAEFGLPLIGALGCGLMMITYSTFAGLTEGPLYALITRGSPIICYFVAGTKEVYVPFLSDFVADNKFSGGAGLVAGAGVATVVLFVLAFLLFVRRRSERAGTAIAFEPVKEPLKWFMSASVGLSFAFLFELIMGKFWFWFGLVAGTILFHMLVEIIYDFDFRALFHNWKRLIVLLVLVVAGVFAFRQDLTGYDTYLPARDQIVSAGVGGYGLYDGGSVFNWDEQTKLTDPADLDAVYKLAKLGVAGEQREERNVERCSTVQVRFTLRNGRSFAREYDWVEMEAARGPIRDLITSPTFMEACARLQQIALPETEDEGSATAQIRTNATPYGGAADATVRDLNAVRELVATLRAAQVGNAEQHANEIPVLRVDLHTEWMQTGEKSNYSSVSYVDDIAVFPSDTAVLDCIRALTSIEPTALKPEQVQSLSVVVSSRADYEAMEEAQNVYYVDGKYYTEGSEPINAFWQAHETVLGTDDAQTIAVLLENAVPNAVASLSGIDAAFEEDFDGMYVEVTATVGGSDISLSYPVGKAPIAVLRTYLK